MVNPRDPFLLATAIALLAWALLSGEVKAGLLSGENELGWAASWSACNGTIGECLGEKEAEEMAMDSESNRRILQGTGGYIIYKPGLSPDQTSCPNPGAPYSNCRPGAASHPYSYKDCKGLQCYRHNAPA